MGVNEESRAQQAGPPDVGSAESVEEPRELIPTQNSQFFDHPNIFSK